MRMCTPLNKNLKIYMQLMIEYLKSLPKEILLIVIYNLMVDEKITFHDFTQLHIDNLERLKKGETEAYNRLQQKVITMWVDKKKNLPTNLQSAMQLLYDEGRVNITQEKIDNYDKKRTNTIRHIHEGATDCQPSESK